MTQTTRVDNALALEAALERIEQLELQLKTSEFERRKANNQLKVARDKLSEMKKNLSKFIGPDQLQALNNKKVQSWSKKTLKKAYILRIRGGKSLLDFVRKNIIPAPSDRTLRRQIQLLPFAPGILNFNIEVLSSVVAKFSNTQKHFGIVFDEKSLTPG